VADLFVDTLADDEGALWALYLYSGTVYGDSEEGMRRWVEEQRDNADDRQGG
jgi:hypothetical protein